MSLSKHTKKHLHLYITLALACILLSIPIASAASSHTENISVSAESAVLIEASSGRVIYTKSPKSRMPMASITKVMTAIVALEYADDIGQTVTVDSRAIGTEGSSVYLHEGEKISLSDLLYALMLASANDAAVAIACALCPSESDFVALMNRKAEELGLFDTHFDNPHGLPSATHYTTADDFARLSAYAMQNETFRTIVSTQKKTIPLNETDGVRLLVNHNKLLRLYAGAIGIKTGFTRKSGRCLVSAAERDGMTLIAVTLNAPDDWNDHARMLDLGFDSLKSVKLAQKGQIFATLPLSNSKSDSISVLADEDISAILDKGAGTVECELDLPHLVIAPIKAGMPLGRAIFKLDGKVIAECRLVCSEDAPSLEREHKNIFDKFREMLPR